MKKTTNKPKELKAAFLEMISTRAIYKKLGHSEAYPAVIRMEYRNKGILPKEDTMRELLIKAGWQKKQDETWAGPVK